MLKDMFETLMVQISKTRLNAQEGMVDYEDLGLNSQSQVRNFEQTISKLQEEIKKVNKMQQESTKQIIQTGIELEHAKNTIKLHEEQLKVVSNNERSKILK